MNSGSTLPFEATIFQQGYSQNVMLEYPMGLGDRQVSYRFVATCSTAMSSKVTARYIRITWNCRFSLQFAQPWFQARSPAGPLHWTCIKNLQLPEQNRGYEYHKTHKNTHSLSSRTLVTFGFGPF